MAKTVSPIKRLEYFSSDHMLDDIQRGRILVQVGVKPIGDGSRRLLKGKNLRQPVLRGNGQYTGRGG